MASMFEICDRAAKFVSQPIYALPQVLTQSARMKKLQASFVQYDIGPAQNVEPGCSCNETYEAFSGQRSNWDGE